MQPKLSTGNKDFGVTQQLWQGFTWMASYHERIEQTTEYNCTTPQENNHSYYTMTANKVLKHFWDFGKDVFELSFTFSTNNCISEFLMQFLLTNFFFSLSKNDHSLPDHSEQTDCRCKSLSGTLQWWIQQTLSEGGGGKFAYPASFSSFFFFFLTHNKEGGGPQGPPLDPLLLFWWLVFEWSQCKRKLRDFFLWQKLFYHQK